MGKRARRNKALKLPENGVGGYQHRDHRSKKNRFPRDGKRLWGGKRNEYKQRLEELKLEEE